MRAPQEIAGTLLREGLGVRVSTRRPAEPPSEGFVIISRIGGGNDDWATKDPRFLIECYHPSEGGAELLAEKARDVWRAHRGGDVLWTHADNNLTRLDDPDIRFQRFQFTGGLKLRVTI